MPDKSRRPTTTKTPKTKPKIAGKRAANKPAGKTAAAKKRRAPAKTTGSDTLALVKGDDQSDLLVFVEDLKRQWMSTIDALVDPLMMVGHDFIIRKGNMAMARLGGSDVKEIVGRKCHEVFAGRKSPCPGCALKRNARVKETTAGTAPASTTFELSDVNGDRFYEVSSQEMLDAAGRPDGFVHVYRDRTEQKKMQSQLAQQDKLASIGLLAGGVAHEINNPLGGILIFSQMLLRELPKSSPHYADVVEIEAATQRCKAIVESLLDFARQNPSGPKSRLAEINTVDAIRTAIRFGRVSFQKAGRIDLREDFDDTEHRLVCDRNRIIQVFLNLIQNAVQAMPDGGTLMIRSRQQVGEHGEMVGIYEVEDTGVGISPENLGRIFDPFFTTKDPGEGTGLGLALCYGIVQDLRGKMSVTSSLNIGTRFTIELPLKAVRALEKPAS